jgi:hypothetical protein
MAMDTAKNGKNAKNQKTIKIFADPNKNAFIRTQGT